MLIGGYIAKELGDIFDWGFRVNRSSSILVVGSSGNFTE